MTPISLNRFIIVSLSLMLGAWAQRAEAYTPNLVSDSGSIVKWNTSSESPVNVVIEDGNCLAYSNADMVSMLTDIVSSVNGIAQSKLGLGLSEESLATETGNMMNGDITAANYTQVLALDNAVVPLTLIASAQNPLIFDETGQITADFVGPENVSVVLGFAYPFADFKAAEIVRSEEVINCSHSTIQSSEATLSATILHELMHGLGSGHSQLDTDIADGPWPLMYPILYDPTFKLDDTLSLASLYPESTLESTFWTLKGSIKDSSGADISGANLILRNSAAPTTEILSYVTGTSADLSSGACTANCSSFEFKGLTLGATYELSIEPVNASFTGGSAVGRYDPPNANVPTAVFSTRFTSAAAAVETVSIACTSSDCSASTISCSTSAVCGVTPTPAPAPAPAPSSAPVTSSDDPTSSTTDPSQASSSSSSGSSQSTSSSGAASSSSGAQNQTADEVVDEGDAGEPQDPEPDSGDEGAEAGAAAAGGCGLVTSRPSSPLSCFVAMIMAVLICIAQRLRKVVIPAKAGIHWYKFWIPAFAGMTPSIVSKLKKENAMSLRKMHYYTALVFLMLSLLSAPLYATSLSPDAGCFFRLSDLAPVIVDATCTKIESATLPNGGFPVTRYTFSINRAFKGVHPKVTTLVVNQYPRVGASYANGERYLLFLTSKSKLGLQNAIGFNGGRFRVAPDADGNLTLVNGFNNIGLFSACSPDLFGSHYNALSAEEKRRLDELAEKEGSPVSYDRIVELLDK